LQPKPRAFLSIIFHQNTAINSALISDTVHQSLLRPTAAAINSINPNFISLSSISDQNHKKLKKMMNITWTPWIHELISSNISLIRILSPINTNESLHTNRTGSRYTRRKGSTSELLGTLPLAIISKIKQTRGIWYCSCVFFHLCLFSENRSLDLDFLVWILKKVRPNLIRGRREEDFSVKFF